MEIPFSKMEGLGNDFIIMDDRDEKIRQYMDYSLLSRKLCSRHFGIGADGIILVLESVNHDMKFLFFNSDGSQARMCGNGIRCFARYIYEKNVVRKKIIRVDTKAGTIISEISADNPESVKVDMGEPAINCKDIPFRSKNKIAIEETIYAGNKNLKITTVSVGRTPHAVIFADDIESIDIKKIGRVVENHERFPEKTNVEFIQVVNERELKMKVWERGAGLTLACGTGACASLVAANLTGKASERATVRLDGGNLEIYWDRKSNHVYKTGPANHVFEGSIRI